MTAKRRIGYFVEAQIPEAIGIDHIDESEVLSPADDVNHIDKRQLKAPLVCGASNLGEALGRVSDGASMIRTKGEAGTGDITQAVGHMRAVNAEIRRVASMREDGLYATAKETRVPIDPPMDVHRTVRPPVVDFAAAGVATPADAAPMMRLGAEDVFVGSGYSGPATRPRGHPPSRRPCPIARARRSWRSRPRTSARRRSASTGTRSRSSTA